jgi:integrase/recombinase XerD
MMSSGASVCARHGVVGALDAFLESFVSELEGLGYSVGVVRKKRAVVAAFAGWVGGHQLDVTAIDEAAVEAFLGGSGGGDPGSCGGRRRALLGFLEHLRAAGVTVRPAPVSDESYGALLEKRYRSYLRCERGLVEGTVACYGLYVGEFVREHFGTTAATAAGHPLDAADVRGFLLRRARSVTPRTAQLVATALRSFLRFLFLQGVTTLNLALAIPTVPAYRQARAHAYLRSEEVNLLLAACDRATANGRRDHAILLLLARLGVRACEVAALELGDVRWPSGEIVVRGKGSVLQRLPLLPDVGAALAEYLREGRPQSECRSLFLRNDAPRLGLGPDGVGFVVRRALARAGLRPPQRGSHLLRFSLATNMLHRGASMAEIGQVLGHRARESTEIYAKVDFTALRTVALPWVGAREVME